MSSASPIATTTQSRSAARRGTAIWLALIAATLLTWTLGEMRATGRWVMLGIVAIIFAKGHAIISEFMELRDAPLLWRMLIGGWLALVCILIALAYGHGAG